MTASSIAAISVAAAIAFAASPAFAQNAEAEAMFVEGESLLKSGKIAAACDAFESSHRIEPRAGTSINVGICREKNGQLATAWAAYKDAAMRAKDPKKKQIATEKSAAIEPRLSKLTITIASTDGVTIARNGKPVDVALVGRPVPVDGGAHTITVEKPGFETWTTTVNIANERAAQKVDVPALAPKKTTTVPVTKQPPPVKPPIAKPTVVEPEEPKEAGPSMFTSRRKIAVAVGAIGLAGIGAGVALGLSAKGLEDDAFELCPDTTTCTDANRANDLLERGRTRALMANISYGVGGAAIVGAVVLWITGSPKRADDSIAVVPVGNGFLVQGRF